MVHSVCVCGAGTMGSGIAQTCAQSGIFTIQYDLQNEMLVKSKQAIEKNLQSLVDKNKMDAATKNDVLARILFTTDINNCVADLIIEAIVEKPAAKIALFNQLAELNHSDVIFASNTSSISINLLQQSIMQPQRVVGMHFFNPATIMKLVEVVKGEKTLDTIAEDCVAFCKLLGKTAVLCADAPGFIVNRVARHYYLEAMTMVEQGYATMENVDALMESAGFKMGPFKLMDLIGLDINYGVSEIVWNALGQPERLRPSALQKQKVDASHLGKKTGKGFYDYSL